jgi:hypothetical protein
MTVFDGSTPGVTYGMEGSPAPAPVAAPAPAPVAAPAPEMFDALDALREQMDARDEEEQVAHVDVPGLGWRLVCDLDFQFAQFKDWQKMALPPSQRGGRKVNMLDMDQAILMLNVLLGTCRGLEYRTRDGKEWRALLSRDGGEPLTLVSPELLDTFNVMDGQTLIRKLFRSDAQLVKAGQQVVTEAGWNEDGDAGVDPTG